ASGQKGYPASQLHLKFKLFLLLQQDGFKTQFPDIARYYEGDEKRRLQLAEKLADLFDQYQVYRLGEIGTLATEEPWQAYLWEELKKEKELVLKIELRNRLLEELEKPEVQARVKALYPQLIFFTQSHFPDFYWEVIVRLDKLVPVSVFALLPSKSATKYIHPLLTDWGKQAEELRDRLKGDFEWKEEHFEAPNGDTLLGKIQRQILDNCPKSIFTDVDFGDRSIEVNGCYTPVREVETLYNYLVDRFDSDPDLKPEEVMVVAPDMDVYAPFVEGIFKNAPKAIPYHIAGVAQMNEHSIFATLRDILEFSKADFTSEKVLGLLEKRRVRTYFGVEDTDYLRAQVDKANIRFGWENDIENETVYVGWKYNLERFIMGYAMLTDEELPLEEGITAMPFKEAESSNAYDLLRLAEFVERLHTQLEAREAERTLSQWIAFLFEEILDKMVATDFEDKEELADLHKRLSFLERITDSYADEISYEVFLGAIESLLFTEMRTSPFRIGSVRFTSAASARAIPKKVIACLGMNQSEFPRQDHFAGFDLMGMEYKPWDRRKRENDKSLFLDLFTNAQLAFYISYLGMDAKDNTELPASIVIDELLDFASMHRVEGARESGAQIMVQHPLHGFSGRYQKENKRLFTYLYGNIEPKTWQPVKTEMPEPESVDIKQLIKFFDSPLDWYYEKVLEIRFEENDNTVAECEPFDLDGLEQWMVKKQLLEAADQEEEALRLQLVKSGMLPLGPLGRTELRGLQEIVDILKEHREQQINNRESRTVTIDLKFDGPNLRLTGTIGDVYEQEYIHASFSDITKAKYKTRFILQHLALSAADEIESSWGVSVNSKGEMKELPKEKDTEAKAKLEELMNIYIAGNKTLLLYHPQAKTPEIADATEWHNSLKSQFTPGDYNYYCSPYGIHLLKEGLPIKGNQIELINRMIKLLELEN
ncbi:MAG: exodeoxyribonuclease V subunit gamma, partial [Bacteroidales bacterium]